MTQIFVKYNPYRMQTTLKINGHEIPEDSSLYKVTKGKRLQEWIGKLPTMLREELNTLEFSLEFCGTDLDWDDFIEAFEQAAQAGDICIIDKHYVACKSHDDVTERIVQVFHDLQEGPIDDFKDPKLIKSFENIENAVFPVNVIATMSSGKSTLINALLRKKLMPSKNQACTATITEILDTDSTVFSAKVYDDKNKLMESIPDLSYEIMDELNSDPDVHRICAQGDIPFLDSDRTALMLIDTPGPNNAQNQAHKNTTFRAINNDSNNLILYVLNGTQLSTNDDAALLHYVSEQIRKGGKQVRDRFLFVINKMDEFNPEEERIEDAIESARNYLAAYGIEDPQLFPCSAYLALYLRTELAKVDIDNMTRQQSRQLPVSAKKALDMTELFMGFDDLRLEQYTTLAPSAQQMLNYRLAKATENGDTKEEALIHSGVPSVEAAISAYVKKYAKTKQVKDLVETFQEVLESSQVLVNAKTRVASDEEAAAACAERAAAIRQKIANGKEAATFKERIKKLDPMPQIKAKADKLSKAASDKVTKVFAPYGVTITNRDTAKHLINHFASRGSDALAELAAEIESVINREIVNTGERLLIEYQQKLTKMDDSGTNRKLDFHTVDLVKGALKNMRDTAVSWNSESFALETIADVGTVLVEEKHYYEKVGEKKEEIIVGTHREKVGTERVKVGSHREKVGTRQVKKKGLWGAVCRLFGGGYTTEDIYETVDDYENRDVYKTVTDYKTVVRDIFEPRVDKIEKYTAETKKIQSTLVAGFRVTLSAGIEEVLEIAQKQVQAMKKQFEDLFNELDKIIARKYEELEKCATDESEKMKNLEENRKILEWIETCMKEIDEILDV